MGLKITNAASDRPEVWLYGTIGDEFDGVTVEHVKAALSEIPKNKSFDLRIYSDGGDFDAAMAMHSLLSSRSAKSRGIVDGLAASAASLLLQATGDRVMSEHSRQMIHQVHGRFNGFVTADQFREMADQMDATNGVIRTIYARKWSGSDEELRAALSKDSWYTAQESVARGLADRVSGESMLKAAFNGNYFKYTNVPDDVIVVSGPIQPAPDWKSAMETKLKDVLAI
jgi:ATP-dependent protease ClpP protease subunit